MGITFSGCTFGYRASQPVFKEFDLAIDHGLTVLLGPNGAGKSTLLGLAATVYRPQGGTVSIGGLTSADRRSRAAYRKRVGWLPQRVSPIPGMRVREQVAYAAWLKGVSRSEAWERSYHALAKVALSELADRPAGTLSGGQVRRMGIAQALVHEAQIILMDEPTAGLDPRQRRAFRETLAKLPEDIDVVVSTHQTEDLTESYQHVVVLDHSKVRFHGSVNRFLASAPGAADTSRRAEVAYLRLVGADS